MIKSSPLHITDATGSPDERVFELGLRPQTLAEYVGQTKIKETLAISMQAASQRGEPMEHVILSGHPGLGKTTLANIIAHEMNATIRITSGPAIEKMGDLAAIVTSLQKGDILFIDEIHRLHKTVEEMLYPATEDNALDIILGKGPGAKTVRLTIPPFTLIGATTQMNLVAAPLRDRFGHHFHLEPYAPAELALIIAVNAQRLHTEIDPDAVTLLSTRCRYTPRIANRVLKRVRDYAQVKGNGTISSDLALAALDLLGIDSLGLDAVDRKIVRTIITAFGGGPVGINTIAAATNEEVETIEEIHEPFLLQVGFLQRTAQGRRVTPQAYTHLGLTPPSSAQLM